VNTTLHLVFFPMYLINDTIFRKLLLKINCVFVIFPATSVYKMSHSQKNSERQCHKCISVFTSGTRYSCQILMKLEIFQQVFEQSSDIKFHEYLSCGSGVVPCGQTDMMKLIVALHNVTKVP
jgi:hypothetical protein